MTRLTLRGGAAARAGVFCQERQDDSDGTRPATDAEINQLTGERDRWLPPAEEWLIFIVMTAAYLIVESRF